MPCHHFNGTVTILTITIMHLPTKALPANSCPPRHYRRYLPTKALPAGTCPPTPAHQGTARQLLPTKALPAGTCPPRHYPQVPRVHAHQPPLSPTREARTTHQRLVGCQLLSSDTWHVKVETLPRFAWPTAFPLFLLLQTVLLLYQPQKPENVSSL
eukprot:SAG11_NODE_2285_length_3571_cov_2.005184_6_plen_156_part_00